MIKFSYSLINSRIIIYLYYQKHSIIIIHYISKYRYEHKNIFINNYKHFIQL